MNNRPLCLLARPVAAFLLAAASALLPTTSPLAQTTIRDTFAGNTARYTVASVPTAPNALTAGTEFNANPCNPTALNLFAVWPLYQVMNDGTGAADPTASVFNDSNGQLVGPTLLAGSRSMRMTWANVDGRGLFSATYTITIQTCGRQCGEVTHSLQITNLRPNPITLRLFAYADIDLNDSFGNDLVASQSLSNRHIVVDDDGCGGCIEFWGDAPSNYEVATYPAIETRLLSSGGPLLNSGLQFGPSDYEGAMQWNRTLAPAASSVVTFALGHNCLQCDSVANSVSYGTPLGTPRISTTDLPVPGCEVDVAVRGPANGSAVMMLGFQQVDLPIPGCLERLLVVPALSLPVVTDPTGAGTFTVPGLCSPGACGVSMFLQAWYIVPSGPGCLPLVHSGGLRLNYGGR